MVDVGHVGRGVAIRKDPLVPLVEDVHGLENVPVSLHRPRQVRVQRIVAAAVPEVADNDHAVFSGLQNTRALPEEAGQAPDEFIVATNVSEIARVVAVACFEAIANPLLTNLMIRLLIQYSPVWRAGNDEVDRVPRQLTDERAGVAELDNLPSLIRYFCRDLGTEPLLSQMNEPRAEFHSDTVALLERARLKRGADAGEWIEHGHPAFGEHPDEARDVGERERRGVLALDPRVRVAGAEAPLRPDADALAEPFPGGQVVECVARGNILVGGLGCERAGRHSCTLPKRCLPAEQARGCGRRGARRPGGHRGRSGTAQTQNS